jgi:CRISPR-associated protein Csd2
MTAIKSRYDFVVLFDMRVSGAQEAESLPHMEPDTGHGLVTELSLRRRVRHFVQRTRGGQEGFEVYIKDRLAQGDTSGSMPVGQGADECDWMCRHFYDIRTFGAVVLLPRRSVNHVLGAVQLTFGRSVEPIISPDLLLASRRGRGAGAMKEPQKLGRSVASPYGLYRAHGFVSPALAQRTHFSPEDLELLWEALGSMSARHLLIFEHESALGNASAHRLFDLVKVARKNTKSPAQEFSDYLVRVDSLPAGVRLVERRVH